MLGGRSVSVKGWDVMMMMMMMRRRRRKKVLLLWLMMIMVLIGHPMRFLDLIVDDRTAL